MKTTPERKFAHEPIFDKSKGLFKVYCRCGGQSKRDCHSWAEAANVHRAHVGLKEMEKKGRIW